MAQNKRHGRKLQPFYIGLAAVAVIGIGAIVYAAAGQNGGAMATDFVDMSATMADARALYEQAEPMTIGQESAPVKLVVFSDYMCPYCGNYAAQVKPVLQQRYVEAGLMQVVLYDFPLGGGHRHSFLAARAARCAGDQNQAWEYHDLLFGRMSQWSPQDEVADDFVDFAADLGLDVDAFEGCLRSDRYADVVTANRLLGEQLGVNATPTVIVDGKRLANPFDLEALDAVVRERTGG